MRAKEFIPATKPRNFVAKNQKTAGAGAHKDKKKAEKQGDLKHKNKQFEQGVAEGLNELSNEKLAQYKKAAGDQATAADKAGDYDKGHKRFKGIVKATNKQFDNDAKERK